MVLKQVVLIYSIFVFLEGKDLVAEHDELTENWRKRTAAIARPETEVSISPYFAS